MTIKNKKADKDAIIASLKEVGVEVVNDKVNISDIQKILANESNLDKLLKHKLENEKRLLKEALEVQNAVNLLGVSKGFANAIQDLYDNVLDRSGMNDLKKHPVAVLWLDKLTDLLDHPGSEKINEAYNYAAKVLKAGHVEAMAAKISGQEKDLQYALVKKFKNKFGNRFWIKPGHEWGEGAILWSGEGATMPDGMAAFNYWYDGTEGLYDMGVHKDLQAFTEKLKLFWEPNDAGTYLAYKV
jgi:hypothetical protein